MAAPVHLVDFYCYRPPAEYMVKVKDIEAAWWQRMADTPFMRTAQTDEAKEKAVAEVKEILEFQHRVFTKSGLAEDGTFLPPSINPGVCGGKPDTGINAAYKEAHEAMCGAVEGLLAQTGLAPVDVDILVTTCSVFCPTPSMASMIVNNFKMRKDIQSYHLGGMGCSNGVVAVNLIRDLLKAHPGKNAILVTHETTTPAFYSGRDRARLVTNVLFRMGACAALFSDANSRTWHGRAKYELVCAQRVHTGARDDAYRCIWLGPDDEGNNGVALGMSVVTEASRGMTVALKKAAPYMMTAAQKLVWVVTELQRALSTRLGKSAPPPYQPRFNQRVRHFLLHAGGAKVLDGLGVSLQLTERDVEPSRAVLHDYGNVSSSTTWYTMGYIETVRGVKTGDRVMQVGVGSGIKCGVNVWKALRNINDAHDAWEHRLTPAQLAAATARKRRAQPALRATQTTGLYVARVLFWLVMLALAWLAYSWRAAPQPGRAVGVPLATHLQWEL